MELLLEFRPHPDLVERLERHFFGLELDQNPLAGRRALRGESRRIAGGFVLEGERAGLAALSILRIRAAKQLEGLDRGIAGFAGFGLASDPHAVDHRPHGDALLREIEHHGRRPAADALGQDFTSRAEARRLAGHEQSGIVGSLVGAALGQQL